MQMMAYHFWIWGFENDVNMYGTQATMPSLDVTDAFENDVNIQYRQIFHDNGI